MHRRLFGRIPGQISGRISFALIACLLLFWPSARSRAETACVSPTQLAHAGLRITRYFDEAERAAQAGLAGIQGSGWFLTPTTIVTVAHVVTAMNLTTLDWKRIEIGDGDDSRSALARIQRLAGRGADKLVVLELQTSVAAARSLAVRVRPLAPDERVVTLGYPDGHLRVVSGRFVHSGDDSGLAGRALLEMYDGDDRLAVDHGASGAPVFDCDGHVAAVVTDVVTQTMVLAGREMRLSTAWGTPNVVSVPIQALQEPAPAD